MNIAPLVLAATLFTFSACGGMFQTVRPPGTPADAECMTSWGGEVVCGYGCMAGGDGVVHCADSKDGECTRNFDNIVHCDGMPDPEPAPVATELPPNAPTHTMGDSPDPPEADTPTESTDAYCCVNGAFYQCPDVGAVAVCAGEPMSLMSCLQNCPMMGDGSCENQCAADHGPQPDVASCQRTPARDGECGQ